MRWSSGAGSGTPAPTCGAAACCRARRELLQVQADLRGADLSAEVARIGSTLSARIATVTQGTARDVASVLGGAYTLFGDQFEGDTTERLGRIGELLTATQKKYKFTVFGDLGAGLKLAAAGAKSANLPLDQTAVALGLLSKAELAGERGGTALSAVLRQLSTKEVARFGVQIARTADGSLDLVATLANLKDRLARIGDTDVRNRTIQELFGDEGARGLVPLLDQLGAFEEGLAGVRNPIENIDQAHQRWLDSASGKSAILRNNLTSLRDTIATGLVPAVEPLIGVATGAAVEIGAMAERTPILAVGLKVAAGAVGAFVGASLLIRGGRWAVLQLVDSYRTTIDVAGRAARAAGRFGLAAGRGVVSGVAGVGRFVGAVARFTGVARVATAVQWALERSATGQPDRCHGRPGRRRRRAHRRRRLPRLQALGADQGLLLEPVGCRDSRVRACRRGLVRGLHRLLMGCGRQGNPSRRWSAESSAARGCCGTARHGCSARCATCCRSPTRARGRCRGSPRPAGRSCAPSATGLPAPDRVRCAVRSPPSSAPRPPG